MSKEVRKFVSKKHTRGLVYGVGYDDTDYQKECRVKVGKGSKVVWYCKAYSTWKNMLRRCYHKSGDYLGRVTVATSWLTFSNFKLWFDKFYQDGWQIDKDCLGGTEYSEKNCIMMPQRLNNFLMAINLDTSGVWWDASRGNYQAYCKSFGGGRVCLGRFKDFSDAKRAWFAVKKLEAIKAMDELSVPDHVRCGVMKCLSNLEVKYA